MAAPRAAWKGFLRVGSVSCGVKIVGVVTEAEKSRDANPDLGEYGAPTTLYTAGEVPDMEYGLQRRSYAR